jgi:hypothetical protein
MPKFAAFLMFQKDVVVETVYLQYDWYLVGWKGAWK